MSRCVARLARIALHATANAQQPTRAVAARGRFRPMLRRCYAAAERRRSLADALDGAVGDEAGGDELGMISA